MQERARIVLLTAEGMASHAVTRKFGCMRGMVSKWRFVAPRIAYPGPARPGTAASIPNTGQSIARVFSPCWTGRRRTVALTGRHG